MPDTIVETPKVPEAPFGLAIEEMAKAGLHFGHRVSRVHPKMRPYIFGTRNTVHILDLEKTMSKFAEALEFLKKLAAEKKTILFVGTRVQAKKIVQETAIACKMPYVASRWIGGTFTNFETVHKRVEYFRNLEQERQTGQLLKYTKKEQLQKSKELQDLQGKFGGIKDMDTLPDALFVADVWHDTLAVREAIKMGVPVVGVVDTNTDPSQILYPIPANDDASTSLAYILEKVKVAIQ